MARNNDSDYIYVFPHLSKTGGTSIYRHLRKYFLSESELVYLGPEGDAERARLGAPPLANRPEAERQKVRILMGHQVKISTLDLVPWREPRLIFFVRHPASRMISKYNFQMYVKGEQHNPIPFEDWRLSLKPNAYDTSFWLCRRFLELPASKLRNNSDRQEIAERLLRQFYLVSTTERMDIDIVTIFDQLGVPSKMDRENVAGRDHAILLKPTRELTEKICQEFTNELAFYTRWAKSAPYYGRSGRPRI